MVIIKTVSCFRPWTLSDFASDVTGEKTPATPGKLKINWEWVTTTSSSTKERTLSRRLKTGSGNKTIFIRSCACRKTFKSKFKIYNSQTWPRRSQTIIQTEMMKRSINACHSINGQTSLSHVMGPGGIYYTQLLIPQPIPSSHKMHMFPTTFATPYTDFFARDGSKSSKHQNLGSMRFELSPESDVDDVAPTPTQPANIVQGELQAITDMPVDILYEVGVHCSLSP